MTDTMDRDPNSITGASGVAPGGSDTAAEAAVESKKGGRKKDKKEKKEKKKPKVKKPAKQKKGKEKGAAVVSASDDDHTGVVDGARGAEGAAHFPNASPRAESLRAPGDASVRRDSGIEEGASRTTDDSPRVGDAQSPAVPEEEQESGVHSQRDKSQSRSSSRKRFSFFRRRGRSGGRDRSKSETDLSKVGRKDKSKRQDSAKHMEARNSGSLDRERHSGSADRKRRKHSGSSDPERGRQSDTLDTIRGRHSLSVDRDRGRYSGLSEHGNARQSASLEREPFMYRHYDPAKQPRDRLQYMTVKDAVTEHKHRVRNLSANSAMRKRAAAQRQVSSSVPDMSNAENGQSEDAGQLLLNPEQRTLVTAVATLPRNARPPGESALPGSEQSELSLGGPSQEGASAGSDHVDGEAVPRKNLGEQILQLCKTISDGRGSEREMTEDLSITCDRTNNADSAQSPNSPSIRRNISSVLYINPDDIVVEPDQRLSPRRSMKESSQSPNRIDVYLDNDAHSQQARLRPSEQFMELRRSTSAFSTSPVARGRRISGSGESIATPQGVSPSLSRHSLDPSVENIPSPGARDDRRQLTPVADPPGKVSPEITVNLAQTHDSPPSSEMVSSTDSWKTKRSSDQGFYSEPKESETDSEGDTSGFSTPPEEPALGKGGPRHPITPSVLVNTVKNLLEVPKPKKINRSVSDNSAEVERAGSRDPACTRTDSTKSDTYVQLKKVKPDSYHDTPEKFEQKTVPVMGTSVQQKYRRTFSPVRGGKGADQHKADDQVIEVLSQDSRGRSPNRSPSSAHKETTQKADDGNQIKGEERLGKELSPEGDLMKRGRDSQRRRGYVSGRSFRRKKDKEADETQAKQPDTTDGAKTAEQKENKAKDGDVKDDISNRLAYYDKSIQTSESLLNDLIKKSKGKRKMLLFSSGVKKTKKHPESEVKLPVGLLPPEYEEGKHQRQAPETSNETVHKETGLAVTVHAAEPVLPVHPETHEDDGPRPDVSPESGVHAEPVAEQHNEALPTESPTPKPKSSLRAIVALKQKLARNRKRKVKPKKDEEKDKEEEEEKKEGDLPSDTFIFIENELNLSKLAEIKETDILDDEIFEPNLDLALPKKQIRFEPIASSEPIQSEEPLPPLSPASRRLAARRNSTRGRERRRKCLHCCKKFVAFLFSHIGLCSLVAGYTFMGGIVFQALEAPHEMDVKSDIAKQRNEYVDRIHSLAAGYRLNELSRDNLTAAILQALISYQELIHKETKENGWDGKDIDPNTDPTKEEYTQWSFASSLLYAITVMTTIGYGHVAPKTVPGRVVTIAYAVLGIPLTLLCLTNIGDVMATGFRLLYGKVCCGMCCKLFRPSRRRRRRVPDVEKGLGGRQVVTEETEADKPKEVIHVPTSLCLLLIAGYISAGALMFSLWEQWDYLTGSYFCFITLSTIGFGDIVPGTNMGDWNQEEKLVLSALYLVFGLSLIAMCFNLVQEDVKAKCRWLGMKIGIIDKPEPPV